MTKYMFLLLLIIYAMPVYSADDCFDSARFRDNGMNWTDSNGDGIIHIDEQTEWKGCDNIPNNPGFICDTWEWVWESPGDWDDTGQYVNHTYNASGNYTMTTRMSNTQYQLFDECEITLEILETETTQDQTTERPDYFISTGECDISSTHSSIFMVFMSLLVVIMSVAILILPIGIPPIFGALISLPIMYLGFVFGSCILMGHLIYILLGFSILTTSLAKVFSDPK